MSIMVWERPIEELLDDVWPDKSHWGLLAYWWYWAYFKGRYHARRLS